MNILHTIPTLDITYGGPATCTYYLVKGLSDLTNVDVLTINSDNILWKDSFVKVVPDDALPAIRYSKNIENFMAVNAKEYDILHANTLWFFTSHQTSKSAHKLNKPFILSPHGMLYPNTLIGKSSWKKKIALSLYQKHDLENATMLHATCRQEMEHLRNFGLTNPIAVVPNCLNIDEEYKHNSGLPRPENSTKRVGVVGRIDRIKNIDRVIKAWHKLGIHTKNAELVIIGGGDNIYLDEMHQFVEMHNMKNVVFKGFLVGNELKYEVHNLDFQVLASDSENFGMVVPEALINRVPVIASKGTPWETLENNSYGNCGWWIDNDIDSIADSLLGVLNMSETDRLAMGENGRNFVLDHFSIETVSRQMKTVYDYVLGTAEQPSCVYI